MDVGSGESAAGGAGIFGHEEDGYGHAQECLMIGVPGGSTTARPLGLVRMSGRQGNQYMKKNGLEVLAAGQACLYLGR